MNVSNKIQATKIINFKDKQIDVESLPKEIRFEVETLDRIAQKKLDILSELEVIELAFQGQRSKISALISNLYPADEGEKNENTD